MIRPRARRRRGPFARMAAAARSARPARTGGATPSRRTRPLSRDYGGDARSAELADSIGRHQCAISEHEGAMLLDIAEFDRKEAWRGDGSLSMRDWLIAQCHVSRARARTLVESAAKAKDLPALAGALSDGRLTLDVFAPLASVATPRDRRRPGRGIGALDAEAGSPTGVRGQRGHGRRCGGPVPTPFRPLRRRAPAPVGPAHGRFVRPGQVGRPRTGPPPRPPERERSRLRPLREPLRRRPAPDLHRTGPHEALGPCRHCGRPRKYAPIPSRSTVAPARP